MAKVLFTEVVRLRGLPLPFSVILISNPVPCLNAIILNLFIATQTCLQKYGEYTNTSTGTEDLSILAVFLSASPQQLCARGPGSTNYFPLGNHKAEYLLLFSCLGVVRMCI